MAGKRVAPYGAWVSPITAEMLTRSERVLGSPAFAGGEVWWSEGRPDEGGRTTVVTGDGSGEPEELLPAPWNARNRVHEYGGRAWLPVPMADGSFALVFTHFADGRIYRYDRPGRPDAADPVPLTPPGPVRYSDLVLAPDGAQLYAVAERHGTGEDADLDRFIAAIPVEPGDPTGSAVREVVSGSRFLAGPRPSPDGSRLAWLAWDHPNMPWDGTELRVGEFGVQGETQGLVTSWTSILGGRDESIFQPEWADDGTLYAVSDRSGWWNLYRIGVAGGEPEPLHPAEEEFGTALWVLGMTTYAVVPGRGLLCTHGAGSQRLGFLDPSTGALEDLDLPFESYAANLVVSGSSAAVVATGPRTSASVVRLDLETGRHTVLRTALDEATLPDRAYLPTPEAVTVPGPGGRDVHAYVYPPSNPDFDGPEGAKPPYVVFVHGGPTSHVVPSITLTKAYFTSRGIGVVDVDYGGSTGYGRAYRDRLKGQWGIVDVEDCEAAALALVDAGRADPDKLAIRGGSAGGWTTLCAVTRSDVFAAGASAFGVSDAMRLAEITHDFESRYLDGLLGGGPRMAEVSRERSALFHAAETRCPVLLLQGADDPIVPLEQAEQFRDALAGKGIPHALLVYEGEQHGFRKAESIVHAVQAELSFYGQVMGFEPPGVPAVELSS